MPDTLKDHARLVDNLVRELSRVTNGEVRVFSTHISSVVLAGEFAYKLKKPLELGFLDYSTLEKRRHACAEEVRLNGRLAPDIYLGVVPVTGSLDKPAISGEGAAIEYAVQMRQFPADALLARHPDRLDAAHLDDIAEQIAAFQKQAAVAAPGAGFGTPARVLAPMRENFEQIRQRLTGAGDLERLAGLERWTLERHAAVETLLQERLDKGFVREGHGDLHLGNIAMDGERLIIFDGIEFNANLRWIDVVSEIAFLMMDLDYAGRPELSRRFLNRWLVRTGDFDGLALVRFYQVYRAVVRIKIAAIRHTQDVTEAERAVLLKDIRAHLRLAESYTGVPRPQLIITFGVSGSGKSTAAAALVEKTPAIQVRSDVERKRLAGLEELARSDSGLGAGLYSKEMSERTYARLLALARTIVVAGFTAILDATFLKAAQRAPFRSLATELCVPFRILAMDAPVEELRRRVSERLKRGADAAEADLAVLEKQLATVEPLDEEEHGAVISAESDQ